jgi:hypothetical protein
MTERREPFTPLPTGRDTFDGLISELRDLPPTWYGQVLSEVVTAAYGKNVFQPGGASILVREVEEKIEQQKKRVSQLLSLDLMPDPHQIGNSIVDAAGWRQFQDENRNTYYTKHWLSHRARVVPPLRGSKITQTRAICWRFRHGEWSVVLNWGCDSVEHAKEVVEAKVEEDQNERF